MILSTYKSEINTFIDRKIQAILEGIILLHSATKLETCSTEGTNVDTNLKKNKCTHDLDHSTHLLGYSVPVQMALTLIHALLVQELALVRNKQGITHKLSYCSKSNISF